MKTPNYNDLNPRGKSAKKFVDNQPNEQNNNFCKDKVQSTLPPLRAISEVRRKSYIVRPGISDFPYI